MRLTIHLILGLLICLGLASCKDEPRDRQEAVTPQPEGGGKMGFTITSGAFTEGQSIPSKHTCDGDDISPELKWDNPPEGTRSFALICDDPDAPGMTWVHWVVWAIPATVTGLPEGIPSDPVLDDATKQGMTDFRRIGYDGPCPPGGKPHRYFFKLYALDNVTNLEPGASKKRLLEAMEGHILAQTQLMGTYSR
jgi:Raf kinase inhibitor-like YbhB/YbcL family protein